MKDSNVGKWASWYANPNPSASANYYGTSDAYKLGGEWLARCALVEDWGCGLGGFRPYIDPPKYIGLDGTKSDYCDEVVDLCEYRSKVPGIFMRAVLEHNRHWQRLLDNAVASFTERMVLCLFTPMMEITTEIAYVDEIGVPDIAFRHEDIIEHLDATWSWRDIESDTAYNTERIYFLER